MCIRPTRAAAGGVGGHLAGWGREEGSLGQGPTLGWWCGEKPFLGGQGTGPELLGGRTDWPQLPLGEEHPPGIPSPLQPYTDLLEHR